MGISSNRSIKLGQLDLVDNSVEAGQLVIVYFWPNSEFQDLEESVFASPEVILDTTAPNTLDNGPDDSPPDYPHLSPLPPHLTPEPSED